jgi:hypothetical protein
MVYGVWCIVYLESPLGAHLAVYDITVKAGGGGVVRVVTASDLHAVIGAHHLLRIASLYTRSEGRKVSLLEFLCSHVGLESVTGPVLTTIVRHLEVVHLKRTVRRPHADTTEVRMSERAAYS